MNKDSESALKRIYACLLFIFAIIPVVVTGVMNEYEKTRLYEIRSELDALKVLSCTLIPEVQDAFLSDNSMELDEYKNALRPSLSVPMRDIRDGGASNENFSEFRNQYWSPIWNAREALGERAMGRSGGGGPFYDQLIKEIDNVFYSYAEHKNIPINRETRRTFSITVCGKPYQYMSDPYLDIRLTSSSPIPVSNTNSRYASSVSSIRENLIKNQIEKIVKLDIDVSVFIIKGFNDFEYIVDYDRSRENNIYDPDYYSRITYNAPKFAIDKNCEEFLGNSYLANNFLIAFKGKLQCSKKTMKLWELVFDRDLGRPIFENLMQIENDSNHKMYYLEVFGGLTVDDASEVIKKSIFKSYDDFSVFGFRVSSTTVPVIIQSAITLILLITLLNIFAFKNLKLSGLFSELDSILSVVISNSTGFIFCFTIVPMAIALAATPFGFYFVRFPVVITFLCISNLILSVLVSIFGVPALFKKCNKNNNIIS